jgi:hypothetical protein
MLKGSARAVRVVIEAATSPPASYHFPNVPRDETNLGRSLGRQFSESERSGDAPIP